MLIHRILGSNESKLTGGEMKVALGTVRNKGAEKKKCAVSSLMACYLTLIFKKSGFIRLRCTEANKIDFFTHNQIDLELCYACSLLNPTLTQEYEILKK